MIDRPHGLTRYKHGPDEYGTPGQGCRCDACRQGNNAYEDRRKRLRAYGRWEGHVPAAGARRRLQALIRNGWSMTKLSARLGSDPYLCRRVLHVTRVKASTDRAVRALFEELWDTPPPLGTAGDRHAAAQARNYARARRYPPALAWDDGPGPHFIDDPDAKPAGTLWKRQDAA